MNDQPVLRAPLGATIHHLLDQLSGFDARDPRRRPDVPGAPLPFDRSAPRR
jgi:hypothetical protein